MALGISNVNVSYSNDNGLCTATIRGNYTVDTPGTHAIGACYVLNGYYVCFEWGDRFYSSSSGSFTLTGLDSTNEYISGYDFYYNAGDEYDLSLLIAPCGGLSDVVGIQTGLTMEACELPPPVIHSVTWSPTNPALGDTVQFTGVATATAGHYIDRWRWIFNDGSEDLVGNYPSPTHQYVDSGVLPLGVEVRDTQGLWGYYYTDITVDDPCVAPTINSVTWDPTLPSVGIPVQFTGVATPAEGYNIALWHWSFGDGTEEYESYGTPTHTYTELGTYTIYVRVRDDCGGVEWDYYATQITVSEEPVVDPPVIESVTWDPTNPALGDIVQFTGIATAAEGRTIDMWNWSFGDGSFDIIANNSTPTHQYLDSGVRTLDVAARDSEDLWGYYNTDITVADPCIAPTINSVTWNPTQPMVGVPVQFTGVATPAEGYAIDMWHWSFGDGSSEVYESYGTPTHIYSEPGTYTIDLRVRDNCGGFEWDYHTAQITVTDPSLCPKPTCVFEAI